jgi:hypothetical protein
MKVGNFSIEAIHMMMKHFPSIKGSTPFKVKENLKELNFKGRIIWAVSSLVFCQYINIQ